MRAWIWSLCWFFFLGCQPQGGGAEPQVVAEVPETIAFDGAAEGTVFRYRDPSGEGVKTATALDEIPVASRAEVVVYPPGGVLPPGWDYVADLREPEGAQLVPRADFSFELKVRATRPAKVQQVVLFATQACPYCERVRRLLKAEGQPYTEIDVERDPSASMRLTELGRAAGLDAGALEGVPITFVDGAPVLGWDEARLRALLN